LIGSLVASAAWVSSRLSKSPGTAGHVDSLYHVGWSETMRCGTIANPGGLFSYLAAEVWWPGAYSTAGAVG
jgi:hypothetical protein